MALRSMDPLLPRLGWHHWPDVRSLVSKPSPESLGCGVSAASSTRRQQVQQPRYGSQLLCGILPGLAIAFAQRGLQLARGSRVIVRGRNYEKNIKNQKGKAEAAKAKLKDRHLRKIIVAVRENGPDEADNPQLKRLIRAALRDNVPRSTIDGRIKKFLSDGETVVEISMAGYGPAGTSVIVDCVGSSSVNMRADVSKAFKQVGLQVGNDGCNDHMFNKQGVMRYSSETGVEEEALVEVSMEADVEDVLPSGDEFEVITLPENLQDAVDTFTEKGLEPSSFDIRMAPLTEMELDEEQTYELKRLLHYLGEVDDVQDVHHNGQLVDGVELTVTNYGHPMTYDKAGLLKK